MVTTPRCRSWPRSRRSQATSGLMSATTGRLVATHRRQPSITLRGIEDRNTPSAIFEASPASCRPTPIAATMRSTIHRASRARSRQHCAGAMRGVSSSSWPISPPMPGAVGRRRRSRRLRLRPSSASTRCSTSSAPSTAQVPRSVCVSGMNRAGRLSTRWKPGCVRSGRVCRARPPLPSRSIICSGAGIDLRPSSTMVEFA